MRTFLFSSVFLLLATLTAAPAGAVPANNCKTPRAAAQTFLDNLQSETWHPERAVNCFAPLDGMSQSELINHAQQLKAVLDHRGLWVVIDSLSDKPDFKDDQGKPKAELVAKLPEVYLLKEGDRWQFPTTVVQRIPTLHAATFSGWVDAVIQALPPVLRTKTFGYAIWQPLALVLLLVLCVIVSRLTRSLVRSRLVRLLTRLELEEATEMVAKAAKPTGILVAAGLFALALPELRLPINPARLLGVGVRVVAAVAAVMLAYRLVDLVVMRLAAQAGGTASRTDDQLVILLRKVLRVIVVAVGIVFILQNLHVNVTSLLAGLGIGGLALALAAKDTAANLFGSITLLIDQPFLVGDAISAAGVDGTVVDIGLRSTRVRTYEDTEVSIPNSKLVNSNIENLSRRTYRRYKVNLGITYDATPDQIRAFVEGIRAIIAAQPDTRKDSYEVHFTGYGAASLDILLQCHFLVPSGSAMHIAKQQLLLEIMRLAAELKVEFAFPTQTIHMAQAPDAAPDADALTASVAAYGPEGARSQPTPDPLTIGYLPGYQDAPKAE